MRERRGAVGRLTGLAEGVAAAARRRQRERSPRVLLYDDEGHPQVLPPDAFGFEEIVAAAERMIDLADETRAAGEGPGTPGGRSSTGGVSVRDVIREPEGEAEPEGGRRDES